MKASVDISMYPLGREFVPDIKEFIKRLNLHSDIECVTNGMSTQVFGPLAKVMAAITTEMEYSFEKHGKSVFVLKVVNSHLKD
jgi:uncharacterized protein YqgV (UPF0045/DUF77 family)